MGQKHNSHLLKPAMLLLLTLLAITALPSQASSCGGDGERACCAFSTESEGGACDAGNIEIAGCSGGACLCGGTGLAVVVGSSSSSSCAAVTGCGGDGQRACCLSEPRWSDNPIPFSAGCDGTKDGGTKNLTEIALPGGVSGGYCGGFNPFKTRSNGVCTTCGSDGARECVGASVPEDRKCQSGLSSVAGWCQQCGGEGQLLCRDDDNIAMCLMGYHPDGGLCRADTVIPEPDCDCEVAGEYSGKTDRATPVVGYADLHLHLFSNLAFGGLTLWGEAFHPEGGISQALRADNFAQRTMRHQINGNTVKGIFATTVAPDPFREQTIIHGDTHPLLDALVGHGTGEGAVSNGGVEWDPKFTNRHFTGWPKDSSTTHQQAYHRWLQRAHKGGLQLTVMLAVNNEAMCAANARLNYPEFDCSDTMAAVRLQLQAAKDMEAWLDKECKAGREHGCAKGAFNIGWFKVVYSPEEAREAISKGQMAAVLGIEESFLFDCRPGSDTCNEEHVRLQLDKYQKIGVRHVFPLHNFDNAFGGAATWQDTVTIGNRYSTGSWFGSKECPQFKPLSCINDANCAADQKFGYDAKDLFNFLTDTPDFFSDPEAFFETFGAFLEGQATLTLGFGDANLISALENKPPNDLTTCNTEGLTTLGNFLIQELMARGMIIDIDHMSSMSVDNTLTIAESVDYPGIVASHVVLLDLTEESGRHERMRSAEELQRIAAVGGMIGVMTAPPDGGIIEPQNTNIENTCANSSMTWGQSYEYAVEAMGVPVAFGTDFNGIAAHTGPRFGEACAPFNSNQMSYPFEIDGFGNFGLQQTGGRKFNFNTDGLAHIGLLPDMIHDLKTVGLNDEALKPLFSSAEKYISMWEGAELAAKDIEPIVDTEPPVLTLSLSTPANAAGWHKQPFTIEINVSDETRLKATVHSTIATPASFVIRPGSLSTISVPVALDEYTGEFFAVTYDDADNNSGAKYADIKIDQLPPLINASHSPRPNSYGWINKPVTVVFKCSDGFSGVSLCSDNKVLNSDGANQIALGSVKDLAGNTAQAKVSGINIDLTPPSIIARAVPLANAAGWVNEPVTVTYQCADSLSGMRRCSPPKTLRTEAAAQSAAGSAEDRAGNRAQAGATGINMDLTPPTIVATRSPLPNAAGWNNEPVTVVYECIDSLSGVLRCSLPQTLLTDAAGQTAEGTAEDLAGNKARVKVSRINIDQVPPRISASSLPLANAAGWINAPVTVTYQCADSLSGVLECSPPKVLLADGAAQSAFGLVKDRAGNKAEVEASGINIDQTSPSIIATRSPLPNAADWNNEPVTVAYACTDSLSGVLQCSLPETILAEGAAQSAAGSAEDLAGNKAQADQSGINIDLTLPTIVATRLPLANAAGWVNEAVTVSYECADSLSGVSQCSSAESLLNDGAAQSALGLVEDLAGNKAQVETLDINIDQVPPTIIATAFPSANAAGWNNEPVAIAYQCADSLSGVLRCSLPETLMADAASQGAVGLGEDIAGNSAQAVVLGINIDQTPPTIVATALPLANAAGWVNQPITINYQCNDNLSGLVSCPETKVLSNDAAEQEVLTVISDLADNTARADIFDINIDQVSPIVEIQGVEDGADYFLGQVPAAVCVTTDDLSGVLEEATFSISGGTSNNVGLYTVNCNEAVDMAGNITSNSASYWARYNFGGFYARADNPPNINKVKAGSSIKIKFSLNGNQGLDIFATESPVSRSVNCATGAVISDTEEATNHRGAKNLRYKAKKDRYAYAWKTDKSWSGSCRQFLLNLDDGSEHAAVFSFKKPAKSSKSDKSKKHGKSHKPKKGRKY